MRDPERQFTRRLAALIGALVLLTVLASFAFALAEHVSPAYGLLWTLDTVTTQGRLREPSNTSGRVIVVVLQLLGIGTLFYGFATVAEFFVSGQLTGALARRRVLRMIDTFTAHYIVCGYGRVGRQVARHLQRDGHRVVVIERTRELCDLAAADGCSPIEGDASDDDTLLAAGVRRATAIISCVDSDAENTFVTLSARGLCPEIVIVARSAAEDAEAKLLRAGANRVISPYETTGAEMARIASHPQVSSISAWSGRRVEQIEVPAGCLGAGRRLGDIRGANTIVALERANGEFEPQPPLEAIVQPGDRLIVLGSSETLEELENAFQPVLLS